MGISYQVEVAKGRKLAKTGYIKGILMMFYNAITKQTKILRKDN